LYGKGPYHDKSKTVPRTIDSFDCSTCRSTRLPVSPVAPPMLERDGSSAALMSGGGEIRTREDLDDAQDDNPMKPLENKD
jgi:hypothetical protein